MFAKSLKQLDDIIASLENAAKPVVAEKNDDELGKAFDSAYLQVSKILKAEKHPSADSLCKMQIDVGNNETRQLIAGIYKYYAPEQLVGKLIVTIRNLKPIKLKGEESQAMLLAGSTEGKREVKVVEPHPSSQPGDRVFLSGKQASAISVEQRCSPKAWETVVAKLCVKGGKATFNGIPLVTTSGDCVCPLPDNSEIH